MATKLDKDLIRESTLAYDGREIQVTLGEDQTISFKLKGMKSGVLSIGILELYQQLKGEVVAPVEKAKAKLTSVVTKRKGDPDGPNPTISLYDLRTSNLVTPLDLPTKLVLEGLICELIKQNIKL